MDIGGYVEEYGVGANYIWPRVSWINYAAPGNQNRSASLCMGKTIIKPLHGNYPSRQREILPADLDPSCLTT